MAMDTGELFFKLSDASGDWSVGHPFGKGDKGDQGVQGLPGAPGLITSVEPLAVNVDLVGASTLFLTLVVAADGKLSIEARRADL